VQHTPPVDCWRERLSKNTACCSERASGICTRARHGCGHGTRLLQPHSTAAPRHCLTLTGATEEGARAHREAAPPGLRGEVVEVHQLGRQGLPRHRAVVAQTHRLASVDRCVWAAAARYRTRRHPGSRAGTTETRKNSQPWTQGLREFAERTAFLSLEHVHSSGFSSLCCR
jgi:hypothetical protein